MSGRDEQVGGDGASGAAGASPLIAVSMGDPLGVGPEIVVKALREATRRGNARFVVIGLDAPMRAAAARAKIEPFWTSENATKPSGSAIEPGGTLVLDDPRFADAAALAQAGEARPSKEGGAASFQWVEDAIALTRRAAGDALRADAIVTAPISKEAWALAGRGKYPGHTELLATRYQSKRAAMLFDSPGLRVVLATIHIPLLSVSDTLTIGRVFDPIDLGNEALKKLGVARPRPRIAVCGLNPHAGEGGLFGDEEERVIGPAIRLAQEAGIDARGPFPADTVFNMAVRGEFDLVVAMYHDQGLIPVKLLAWDTAVNMTLGLPTVRTSPDHGTAFDIAGKNTADPGSFGRAVELAVRMVGSGR